VADAVEGWMERNHFLIRRVHSLLGIFPIGVFLIEHLLTNSLAFWPEKFDEQVHWLHHLHYLFWLEVVFIFIPIAVHAVYGVVIVLQAKNNAHLYPYVDNWRFALQRWTGVITIIFIVTHLLHFRFAHVLGGETYVGTDTPFRLTYDGFHLGLGTWWFPIYAVGLTGAVYHFVNGICTFCITWGITIGDESRRKMSVAAAGLGVLLLVWGFMSLAKLQFGELPTRELAEPPAHASAVGVPQPFELSSEDR
jgi:succinate dehydrogenase / fumarate reductase cytochrome b subunit